jgi:AAHS family 4-hydroxybenzoate transporter-like MFS transporter
VSGRRSGAGGAAAGGAGDGEQLAEHLLRDAEPRSGQLLVVLLCMSLNALDGFDITMMAVVAGDVAGALDLTPDRLGLVFSFALAGMMLGATLIAPLADRFGRRPVMLSCVLVVAASMLLTSTATQLWHFLLLRLVSGLGAGAVIASQAALTAEYSPERYRALSVAVATAGYPLGAVGTAAVAGWVVPAYGWQALFLLGGFLTLSFGLVCLRYLPESLKYLLVAQPPGALDAANRILARLELSPLQALPGKVPAAAQGAGMPSLRVLRVRRILTAELRGYTLTLWALFFFCFLTLYFLQSWLPRLLETAGHSAQTARLAFLLFNLGGVAGIITLGGLSLGFHLSRTIGLFLAIAAAGMLLFAMLSGSSVAALSLALLVGFVLQGGFVGLYAVSAKAYATTLRTTGIGWAIGVGRAGAVVGPLLVGYLVSYGADLALTCFLFSVPLFLASALAIRFPVR